MITLSSAEIESQHEPLLFVHRVALRQASQPYRARLASDVRAGSSAAALMQITLPAGCAACSSVQKLDALVTPM